MTCARRQEKRRSGSTLVESALVFALLVVFLFDVFEYGRYVLIKQITDNAAREGCRLAVAANTQDTNSWNWQTAATIQNRVLGNLGGQDRALTGLTVQVYAADAAGNNTGVWNSPTSNVNIGVEINATYTPMLPGLRLPILGAMIPLFPNTVPIHSKCVMHDEGN